MELRSQLRQLELLADALADWGDVVAAAIEASLDGHLLDNLYATMVQHSARAWIAMEGLR